MAQPLTLFFSEGKTFLGGFVDTSQEANDVTIGGITISAGSSSDEYYLISSPCEVEFELVEKEGKDSEIDFKKIMPLCPVKVSNKDGESSKILFLFPKASTFVSNVTASMLNSDLIDAYKAMTGVKTIS